MTSTFNRSEVINVSHVNIMWWSGEIIRSRNKDYNNIVHSILRYYCRHVDVCVPFKCTRREKKRQSMSLFALCIFFATVFTLYYETCPQVKFNANLIVPHVCRDLHVSILTTTVMFILFTPLFLSWSFYSAFGKLLQVRRWG